jgi:hypothetical protein
MYLQSLKFPKIYCKIKSIIKQKNSWVLWVMSVIPATQEVAIERTVV